MPRTGKTTKEELFKQSKDAVKNKIAERITNANAKPAKSWKEFPEDTNEPFDGKLSLDLQLTGDVDELAEYYMSNEDQLSDDAKDYLKGRIGTALYLNELQEEQKKKPKVNAFGVKLGSKDDEISLTGYAGKYQFQTRTKGCWSCAYAMLLESRGVSLNQKIVRSYRPAMKTGELKDIKDPNTVGGLVKNDEFSPFELADLTSKVLPGSAMRKVLLRGHDAKKADQKAAAKTAMKNYIMEAFKEHRSPVAMNCGGHFVTIVGMKGDELTVLNSTSGDAGLKDTRSIDVLVGSNKPIELCWLQDLKLTKEGALENHSLKNFPGISYDKGKVSGEAAVNEIMNKSGKTFVKASKDKNMEIYDSIYVPEQVPEAFYAMEASPAVAEKKPAKEADKKQTRQAILGEIASAHDQMVDIIQASNQIADDNMTEQAFAAQEEAFRYALAELLTKQTLLVACDSPEAAHKDEDLMKLLRDKNTAKKLAESKEFTDFCNDISTGTILALCEKTPEQREKAVADLHQELLKSIKANKNTEKKAEKNIEKTNTRKKSDRSKSSENLKIKDKNLTLK